MRALHTPQQETNSAYNPGVTFQGGQFLAQGISQAGNAITEGLQRYAANKQESAALDMRFEGTAKPLMEKLKLYGQLADENSPAAALLDKSASWHKLGNNQKKVLLADMLLLGDKTEAEQRRKEAEQYKLGADVRAERSTALAEKTYADTLKRLAAKQQEAEAQRTAMVGMMRDFNRFAEGPQFNGTGMQRPMGQFEAYRRALGQNPRAVTEEMVLGLGRMAVSEDRLNQPGAAADHVPKLIELGGIKTIYSPKGGQFQIAPTGELPANLPEVPGHVAVPNGRGGVVYVKTGAAGERVARPTTAIERHKMIRDHQKDIRELTAKLEETNADKSPKLTGAAYFKLRNQIRSAEQAIQQLEDGPEGDDVAKGAAASPYQEGQTATNPQTGQTLIFRNGQWMPR